VTTPTDCSDLGTDGRAVCDEGYYCEFHYREKEREMYAEWLNRAFARVMFDHDAYREQMCDAGRAHLLPPED
jgi:hypothetical protein